MGRVRELFDRVGKNIVRRRHHKRVEGEGSCITPQLPGARGPRLFGGVLHREIPIPLMSESFTQKMMRKGRTNFGKERHAVSQMPYLFLLSPLSFTRSAVCQFQRTLSSSLLASFILFVVAVSLQRWRDRKMGLECPRNH